MIIRNMASIKKNIKSIARAKKSIVLMNPAVKKTMQVTKKYMGSSSGNLFRSFSPKCDVKLTEDRQLATEQLQSSTANLLCCVLRSTAL